MLSRVTYKSTTAGDDTFTVPFEYSNKDSVLAFVNGVSASITWLTATTVQLVPAVVDAGEPVTLYRDTNIDSLLVEFVHNEQLTEEDLNDAFTQALYATQERQDSTAVTVDTLGQGDAAGRRITNAADAVDDQDLVPYSQMREFVLDEQGGEDFVRRCEEAAELTEELYDQFRDDYAGHGDAFPTEDDGTLFYYDGPEFTQGLYISYASTNDPYLGNWSIVSGVGPQGPAGAQGDQGPIGVTGEQGLEGPQGIQGQQGIQGAIGDTGPAGIKGETGAQGPQGAQGVVGPEGEVGPQGPTGAEGPQGVQGQQGIVGPQGAQGDTGPQGPTGPTGPQGIEGPEGAVGPEGPTGPQGPIGIQGVQGPTGAKGDTGADGQSFNVDESGTFAERDLYDDELEDFVYYATDYSVSAEENPNYARYEDNVDRTTFTLSFTPDGPQSIQVSVAGVVQAPDMYTVTVANDIYTVVLSEPTSATVYIREFSIATGYGALFIKQSDTSGDWGDAMPFGRGPRGDQGPQGVQGIDGVQGPQGDQGNQGVQGIQGPAGPVGPQGATGEVGPQGAVGETGDQGPQGITGPQGPKGIQGSIGPTGPAGPQGSPGLVGPQGPQGDIGPQGQQGPTGDRGPQGAQGAEGARGPTGAQGPQGNTGATGEQGPQGIAGAQGARGEIGATGPTGPVGEQGPIGEQGPDGADGRSSSGKVYSRSRLTANHTGTTVTSSDFSVIPIIGAQDFERQLKLSGIYLRGRVSDVSGGSVNIRVRATYGTNTVQSGYSQFYQTATPDPFDEGTVLSEAIYLTIPANTVGDVDVTIEYRCSSSSTSASVYADGNYSEQYLVELIPASTELGD